MSGFRQQQHADEEIATATVLIEQKRFHIGLKANANGKFLKITEIGPGVGRKNKVKGRTRRTSAQDTLLVPNARCGVVPCCTHDWSSGATPCLRRRNAVACIRIAV